MGLSHKLRVQPINAAFYRVGNRADGLAQTLREIRQVSEIWRRLDAIVFQSIWQLYGSNSIFRVESFQ